MGAAPPHHAGMASGVLNMTRGLGTSLGLSVTGLVFSFIAGARADPGLVAQGFGASALFLAGISVVAALLAALRGRSPIASGPVLVE